MEIKGYHLVEDFGLQVKQVKAGFAYDQQVVCVPWKDTERMQNLVYRVYLGVILSDFHHVPSAADNVERAVCCLQKVAEVVVPVLEENL